MGDVVGAAFSAAMVAFTVGWLSAGLWRTVQQEARKRRLDALIKEEDACLGVQKHPPPREMYLAFHSTSGLWSVGDTEREARKLALARWTRLGEGLPPELRVDDPTPEAWVAGLTIAYLEIDGGEQAMREIVLPSFIDADMAPTPWNPQPDHGWEEA